MSKDKKVLGRGLNNLLGSEILEPLPPAREEALIRELPLSQIIPNPDQPRKQFDPEALEELATSLSTLGLVQPITVRDLGDGRYMIVSGERRWRAAQQAGLATLTAYIRPTQPEEVLQLALIENIQREDLNAIEVALSYQQLIQSLQLSQEALAARVGKKRATISNYLRLLRLPAEVQLGLTERRIDMGHARALLQVADPERQIELYHLILSDGLSVRSVEELARAIVEEPQASLPTMQPTAPKKPTQREDFQLLEQQLGQLFTTKVSLKCNASGKGKLTIPFASDQELERIMQLLERIQH